MKTCFKCGERKEISEFYVHPRMLDGHLNKCKDCTKEDVRQRRHDPANKEKFRMYERARSTTPERKEYEAQRQVRRRKANPVGYKAWRAVHNAIKSGKLSKLPCEICGDKIVEAHHEDYNQPLNVKWLCIKHHHELHQ